MINAATFRERLCLFAIDELHCVKDWKNFRVQYSCVGVVKSRLPKVPFLGVTATMMPRVENIVRGAGGFDYDCPIIRTCLDRPEISLSVFFAEGRTTMFEDLRRFFPLKTAEGEPITQAYQMPKTVFYFRTIRRLMTFVSNVRHIWMPEFGYPSGAQGWVHSFHALMATHDKKRILQEFQKPDTELRILAATEIFGFGAHVPDIDTIVNEESPNGTHSLAQHLGRTAREIDKGQFFLVAEPYTSAVPLASKPARRPGGTTASQRIREAETSDSDASTSRSKRDTQDAARRAKLEPELLEFINAPECHRRTLLKILGDITYAADQPVPEVCCSKCNEGLIPPFRPLPPKDTGSAFVDTMRAKLLKWRSDKAAEITPSGFPVIENLVLVDVILDKLATTDPQCLLNGPPTLSERLRRWRYTEPYEADIAQICRDVIINREETIHAIHTSAIRKRQRGMVQPTPVPNDTELAAAARVNRRNQWLVSVGRQDLIPKAKSAPKPKKRYTSGRPQQSTPQPSQPMSQQVQSDSSQPQGSQDGMVGLQFHRQIQTPGIPTMGFQTPPTTAPLYADTPTHESTSVQRPALASIGSNQQTPIAGQRGEHRAG